MESFFLYNYLQFISNVAKDNKKEGDAFMQHYPNLFSPIQIGKTTVKDRIFMPPLSTNLAGHGYVTDALAEHYSNRAKGGVVSAADAV